MPHPEAPVVARPGAGHRQTAGPQRLRAADRGAGAWLVSSWTAGAALTERQPGVYISTTSILRADPLDLVDVAGGPASPDRGSRPRPPRTTRPRPGHDAPPA